jgi:oligoribonuclease NrnB/cAMP/cGMP phosphodiesterase (DHH superfamily)
MDTAILNTVLNDTAAEYDYIFITDISCTRATADAIMASEYADKYILLDHHKTALYLANYPFCVIGTTNPVGSFTNKFYKETNVNGTCSGTSLTLDFVYNFKLLEEDDFLSFVAFTISAFDTWDWHNIFVPHYTEAFKLSQLFWAIGGDRFVRGFDTKTTLFSEIDNTILEIENEKMQIYCKTNKSKVIEDNITINGREYEYAYAFSTDYHTDFFDFMENEFPDKDFYVIDDGRKYSFRTRKDNVDVSEFAVMLGGGGHSQAAGAPQNITLHFEQFKSLF